MSNDRVCEKHTFSPTMPVSGRCIACIEEANEEAREYLEAAHTLSEGCKKVNKYVKAAQAKHKQEDEVKESIKTI